ncbi:DUF2975 domain-containing protein [Glutamicibacter sp. PS]|uniref:DUF2975 domain-containing protein n=1 Tax=Glutamicibacter sp. PS TaxID=3075634 RepID=UPI002852077F|nr:DUF2975 domain-containing protein [Glutamicibacter sp. PS]MDR4533317.1 DUF2975 domain-containing protein [Glutamicibacter sp. PS]
MRKFLHVLMWPLIASVWILLGAMEVLIPGLARQMSTGLWEVEHLAVPYSVAGVIALAAVQVMILALGVLVRKRLRGRVAVPADRLWARLALTCAVLATTLPVVTIGHLLFVVSVGGPGFVLLAAADLAVGGAVCGLLWRLCARLRRSVQGHDALIIGVPTPKPATFE